jgi:hypothetical protein
MSILKVYEEFVGKAPLRYQSLKSRILSLKRLKITWTDADRRPLPT